MLDEKEKDNSSSQRSDATRRKRKSPSEDSWIRKEINSLREREDANNQNKPINQRCPRARRFKKREMKSKMRRDKAYRLDRKGHYFNEFDGIDCSTVVRKLYEMFGLYQLRMETGKPGVTMQKISLTLSEAEKEDLFVHLQNIKGIKIKREYKESKGKLWPHYKGEVEKIIAKFSKMEQVEGFFDLFADFKPNTALFYRQGERISKEEFLDIKNNKGSGMQMKQTSLSVGKVKGIKGNMYLQYTEIPTIKGGVLTMKYWYEIFGIHCRRKKVNLDNCKRVKYSDEELGFVPFTLDNHPLEKDDPSIDKKLHNLNLQKRYEKQVIKQIEVHWR